MSILKSNEIKNINVVEKDNIAYAAYYKDRGDGFSDVEYVIKSLYSGLEHFGNMNVTIPNKLIEGDKPVITPIKGGFTLICPEEQNLDKNNKHSVLSLNTHQVDIKPNSIEVTSSGKITLSNNAKLSHPSNKYHSYNKPRAIEQSNGDILVTAIDLNSENSGSPQPYATTWFLEKKEDLKFEVNIGPQKFTNRLLFKIQKNIKSDFISLPTKQDGMQIIYSDSTSLFSLNVTKSMIGDIKRGRYINNRDEECLFAVGKGKHCNQFDNKIFSSFLTGNEISNLSAVNTKGGTVVVFTEKTANNNEQQLCLTKLTDKKGEKPEKHIISTFAEPIKSLQLSITDENNVVISAIGEENIVQNLVDLSNLREVATKNFSIDKVKTLSNFVDIIYNKPSKLTTASPFLTSSTLSSKADTTPTEATASPTISAKLLQLAQKQQLRKAVQLLYLQVLRQKVQLQQILSILPVSQIQ